MGDKGEIVSCDLHENKLKRIREGAARLGLSSIRAEAADGRVFREEWADAFDLVLVDAPCSGLGILRKKPDIRRKRADDLFALPVVQNPGKGLPCPGPSERQRAKRPFGPIFTTPTAFTSAA